MIRSSRHKHHAMQLITTLFYNTNIVIKLLKFTKACKRIYHYASSKNFDVFILCVFITGALYYALCKLILNQLIEKRFV